MFFNVKYARSSSALMMLGALALGCGDDDTDNGGGGGGVIDGGVDSGQGNGDGGGGGGSSVGATVPYTGTLVSILGTSAADKIDISHRIELLDNDTGLPFNPPVVTMSGANTGAISLNVPKDKTYMVKITGVGPAPVLPDSPNPGSTYDAVIVNNNSKTTEPLIRISQAGTLSLAEMSGGFVSKPDAAALGATIYWSPKGIRSGTVGCAKVYLDGSATPDVAQDQRYNGPTGLPVRLEAQTQTLTGGRFYVANITKGRHKVKVTLDDGATFLGNEVEFLVPLSRAEATSPTKSMIVQLGIDIDTEKNPTPATCK